MPTIGAVTCDFIKGTIGGMVQRFSRWNVNGVNGDGIHLHGLGGAPTTVRAIKYDSIVNVQSWYRSLEAIQQAGTPVTIENDLGDSQTDCFIEKVGQLQTRPAHLEGGLRGECQINVRKL